MSTFLDPIRPYATAIKWGLRIALALALLSLGAFGGCRWQASEVAAAERKVEKAQRAIDLRTEALHAAAEALRKARNVFQAISTTTRASADEAKKLQAQGEASAAVARRDAATYKRQLAIAEKLLQDERENCTEGRARICGAPLR